MFFRFTDLTYHRELVSELAFTKLCNHLCNIDYRVK